MFEVSFDALFDALFDVSLDNLFLFISISWASWFFNVNISATSTSRIFSIFSKVSFISSFTFFNRRHSCFNRDLCCFINFNSFCILFISSSCNILSCITFFLIIAFFWCSNSTSFSASPLFSLNKTINSFAFFSKIDWSYNSFSKFFIFVVVFSWKCISLIIKWSTNVDSSIGIVVNGLLHMYIALIPSAFFNPNPNRFSKFHGFLVFWFTKKICTLSLWVIISPYPKHSMSNRKNIKLSGDKPPKYSLRQILMKPSTVLYTSPIVDFNVGCSKKKLIKSLFLLNVSSSNSSTIDVLISLYVASLPAFWIRMSAFFNAG